MSVRKCRWTAKDFDVIEFSVDYFDGQAQPRRQSQMRADWGSSWTLGLAFVALLSAAPAHARTSIVYINGNELHEMCAVDQAQCGGYIMGVADALEALPAPLPRSCRPKAVEIEQIIDLTIKALADRPAERHRPAFELIADEVIAHWPC